MHYRNGRKANNGDKIVKLQGGQVIALGVLHGAVPGNDYCNGHIANTAPTNDYACLIDCLHLDDLDCVLHSAGLSDRPGDHEPLIVAEEHRRDEQGRPSGGMSAGLGFFINWQDGPLMVDGQRRDPNGAFVETVLAAVKGRLQHYQDSQFACEYNATAIEHIDAALAALHARAADRVRRGVEGSYAE